MVLLLCAFLAVAGSVSADVYFEEEVVNPGFGKQQTGARKTTNKVYIKGRSQMVETRIEAKKKTVQALRKQGQSLNTSTILWLDRAEVYEIDLTARTFVRQPAPPVRRAAKKTVKKGAPRMDFAVRVPGDTTRVAGIFCRRVVAQLRVRYLDAKTNKPKRENRYTYDACIAKTFPGYREIAAFKTLQDTTTAYPSLIGGGLESLEDFAALSAELEAAKELEGFALRSVLTATIRRAGKKKASEVFRLERQIKAIAHAPLPDSLFRVSKSLTRLQDQ
ncbi:MAG: hypothetical protein VX293_03865 [Candidatus Latescibacterota bacterium]|nr:hypothetical protein [Candidatus Latescibacterota bacterium]